MFIWGHGAFPKSPEVPDGRTPTPIAGVGWEGSV